MIRAVTSVLPPAAKPTINRIGFPGHAVCACAGPNNSNASASASEIERRIVSPPFAPGVLRASANDGEARQLNSASSPSTDCRKRVVRMTPSAGGITKASASGLILICANAVPRALMREVAELGDFGHGADDARGADAAGSGDGGEVDAGGGGLSCMPVSP